LMTHKARESGLYRLSRPLTSERFSDVVYLPG
jgi:hypothetical protein